MSSPRTSVLSPMVRRTGPQMKRQLRYEIFQQQLDGVQLSYCLCEKLNASGLLYNQRFLCVVNGDYVSYGRGIQQKQVIPFKKLSDIPLKSKIIMENLTSYEIGEKDDDRTLKLTSVNGKKTEVWQFRFSSRLICLRLKQRIEDSFEKIHRKQLHKPLQITRDENQFDVSMYIPSILQAPNSLVQASKITGTFPVSFLPSEITQLNEQSVITPPATQQQIPKIQTPRKKTQKLQKPIDSKTLELSNLHNEIQQTKRNYNEVIQQYSELDWIQQLIITDNYCEILQQFNKFSEAVAIKLIDELLIPEVSRMYKPKIVSQYSFQYQYPGLFMRLCWPISPQQNKVNPYEISHRQLRTIQYILMKTLNESLIKVPLASIIQYKGLSVFFKTKVQYKLNQSKLTISQPIEKAIQQFSKLTNFPEQILLSKQEHIFSFGKHFILQDMNKLLPLDPFNHPYQIYPYLFRKIIRHKKKQQQKINPGQLSESRKLNNIDSKMQQLGITAKVSDIILKQALDQLEVSIQKLISPQDFLKIIQDYGLTLNDLPRLYKLQSIPFVKTFISSMMIIQAFTKVFRYRLSNQIKNLSNKKIPFIQKQSHLLGYCLGLINKTFYGDRQNDELWRYINSILKTEYNISLNTNNILNQNLFKHGILQHTLNFKFNIDFTIQLSGTLARRQIIKFNSKIVYIDNTWTPFYTKIKQLIDDTQNSDKSFKQIVSIFSLKTKKLPKHILFSSMNQQIRVFLSNHISSTSTEFSHFGLYRQNKNIYSWIDYYLLERDYFWKIHSKKEIQANNLKFKFMGLVDLWWGEDHPLHLNILAAQHNQFLQISPDDAVRVGKMILIRALKYQNSIGDIKVSECYYLLANTLLLVGRFSQALNNFSSCKSYIQQNQTEKNYQYYKLSLTLSKLYLNSDQTQLCIKHVLECLQFFQFKSKFQTQFVQCCQIIYRYNLLTSQYSSIYQICQSKLPQIKSNSNLSIILKILTQISLQTIPLPLRLSLLSYFKLQHQQKSFNSKTRYNQSANNLKQLISKNIFIKRLQLLYQQGQQYLSKLLQVKRLPKWNQLINETDTPEQQILLFIQSLYYFLDEGWMLVQ